MIIKKKRGMSHIEMILSFIIFVGFLIFLFSIFVFLNVPHSNIISLDAVERAIKDNISVKMDFVTIKINETKDGCFWFEYNLTGNVSVKNESYSVVKGKRELWGNKEGVVINGSGEFFYIYSSENFEEDVFDSSNCKKLNKKDYSIGLFRSYKVVSFEKLERLKENYENDYEGLKENLGLKSDFVFSLNDFSGQTILEVEKNIPKKEVLSRDVPVQLAYSNGTLSYAILNIRVW